MASARDKMIAFIRAQSTELLIATIKKMNRNTTQAAIFCCSMVSKELEMRMSESDFSELMQWCESDLMAA